MQATKNLSVSDHRRDAAGLTYVYPVLSRRSGGVSIGINLNPNNACNWRCIYCQVPGLVRGPAPEIDVDQLEAELRGLLERYIANREPIKDIALSGNGEPTSARQFEEVIARIIVAMRELDLVSRIKLVLITNGSLMYRPQVQAALRRMREVNGEVWFKIDRGTPEGIRRINDVDLSIRRVSANLATSASLCRTWVQTCMFALDGRPPSEDEQREYLLLLKSFVEKGIEIEGVLLYGLARAPQQPEAPRLAPLPENWLREFGREIQALGIAVRISP